ncbi:MAG: MoaD/ThiS family protein [Candidatus Lokiarchaeota archaeon]|nr:MoaD/ThiS family protein [Candidatus Lokiarchaeota archaeon]
MAKVRLNLLNIFQLKTNKKVIEYEGKSVGDIISQFLIEHKGDLGDEMLSKNKKKFNPQVLILLNGRNIKYLKDYKTKLKDSDELYLSFALAGG